jgi:ATP-dependent helicase/nuclease subunit A
MTIHKSKGLEFDVVILPDLGGDLSRPSELMTFHRDPLDPAERVSAYASAEIAEAHPALAEMRDAGISQDVRDALCALYVALTRAKQAVHCIIEASSTRERQLPVTYAGLLRGALLAEGSPATAGETLWAAHGGTADWHLAGGEEADALPEAPEDWVAPKVGSVPGRRLPRTSPSRLEGDAQILGGRALDSDPQALRRGTVLHAWLEAIEWLEQEPDPARLATQAAAMGVEPEDAQAWAAELLGALERPSLRALLTRPEGDVEVRVEQPFEMSVAAGTSFAQRTLEERTRVSGSMDRLVIHRVAGEVSRVEVIDYKSDRIGRGDTRALEERVRHYAPQLAVYRAAAARLLGCPHDRVESSLMFLHCDLHVPCA